MSSPGRASRRRRYSETTHSGTSPAWISPTSFCCRLASGGRGPSASSETMYCSTLSSSPSLRDWAERKMIGSAQPGSRSAACCAAKPLSSSWPAAERILAWESHTVAMPRRSPVPSNSSLATVRCSSARSSSSLSASISATEQRLMLLDQASRGSESRITLAAASRALSSSPAPRVAQVIQSHAAKWSVPSSRSMSVTCIKRVIPERLSPERMETIPSSSQRKESRWMRALLGPPPSAAWPSRAAPICSPSSSASETWPWTRVRRSSA